MPQVSRVVSGNRARVPVPECKRDSRSERENSRASERGERVQPGLRAISIGTRPFRRPVITEAVGEAHLHACRERSLSEKSSDQPVRDCFRERREPWDRHSRRRENRERESENDAREARAFETPVSRGRPFRRQDFAQVEGERNSKRRARSSSADDSLDRREAKTRRERDASRRKERDKRSDRDPYLISMGGADSESEDSERGESRGSRDINQANAVKLLKSWDLNFSGEERSSDPAEFLDRLDDCRSSSGFSDRALLGAVLSTLTKWAARWFRTIKSDHLTWREFGRAFQVQFGAEYQEEDLAHDLLLRTQGKTEKIAIFLSNFRYIASKFKKPLSEQTLADRAYRNLLPEYRRAMSDKVTCSLDDIAKYGRRWEQQMDLDTRYRPPPSAEMMHVPGAAFVSSVGKAKISEVHEVTEEIAAASLEPKKGKSKGKSKQSGSEKSSESDDRLTAAVPFKLAHEAGAARISALAAQGNFGWRRGEKPPNTTGPAPRSAGPLANPHTSEDSDEKSGEFYGACFTCKTVGHKASECPEVSCFTCSQKGHVSRDCPKRQKPATSSCQVCGCAGVTFQTCRKCEQIRKVIFQDLAARGQS